MTLSKHDIKMVEVYGAERCHKSQFYIDYFKAKEIDFTFYDVEENEDCEEKLRSLYEHGKLHFPTIVINDKRLRNPSIKEIEKQLRKS